MAIEVGYEEAVVSLRHDFVNFQDPGILQEIHNGFTTG